MKSNDIAKLIEAGCNVDLEASYRPETITEWVEQAVAKGVHLTVTGHYRFENVIEWARLGGKNFTYRVPRST